MPAQEEPAGRSNEPNGRTHTMTMSSGSTKTSQAYFDMSTYPRDPATLTSDSRIQIKAEKETLQTKMLPKSKVGGLRYGETRKTVCTKCNT